MYSQCQESISKLKNLWDIWFWSAGSAGADLNNLEKQSRGWERNDDSDEGGWALTAHNNYRPLPTAEFYQEFIQNSHIETVWILF